MCVGWWLYRVPIPSPPRTSRRARRLIHGGGGIEMFQENSKKNSKKKKFKKNFKKISIPLSPDNGSWLCRISIPSPSRRSHRARRLLRGGGGIEMFQGKKNKKFSNFILFFILFYYFFSKKFSIPPSPDGAIVHNGSSVEAGGLERNKATNQIYIF
jgi:hypothetical protein